MHIYYFSVQNKNLSLLSPLKKTEASAFTAFSEQVSLQYKNKDVIRFKIVEGQITNALRPVK